MAQEKDTTLMLLKIPKEVRQKLRILSAVSQQSLADTAISVLAEATSEVSVNGNILKSGKKKKEGKR